MGAPPKTGPSRDGRAWTWTFSTYFAEGLPWSLLHQIAGEFFTALGMSASAVGYTSFLHLATLVGKAIWSPLVDAVGSLRGWMWSMQAAMAVAAGALAWIARDFDPAGSVTAIWLALVVIGLMSATHDIGCDGYYMEALDEERQALYSGMRVAAFRAAMFTGSSGIVYLGGAYGWPAAFAATGGLLLLLAVGHALWLPKGRVRRAPAETRSRIDKAQLRASYREFFNQRRVLWVLAFILCFKLADSMMFSMSKVLFRELGVVTQQRAILNGWGTAASITGAVLGGAWVAKRGLRRALLPIAFLMAVTQPLYWWMADAPGTFSLDPALADASAWWGAGVSQRLTAIGTILVIEQLCGGMATAAQMVFIMRRCHPDHRAAHFAFGTAVYTIGQSMFGGFSGEMYEAWGSAGFFLVMSVLTIPAVALVPLVPLTTRAEEDASFAASDTEEPAEQA